MIDIIHHHHQYVPHSERTVLQAVPGTNNYDVISVPLMHQIMIGGDQLTKVRATSAIKQRLNADTQLGRFEGMIPVIEDWHTKMTLLEVS